MACRSRCSSFCLEEFLILNNPPPSMTINPRIEILSVGCPFVLFLPFSVYPSVFCRSFYFLGVYILAVFMFLRISLSIYLSVFWQCSFFSISLCPFICLYLYLSLVCLCVCLFACYFVHLSIFCLRMYLSVFRTPFRYFQYSL